MSKQDTKLLFISLPNIDRFLISFSLLHAVGNLQQKRSLQISSHPKGVALLQNMLFTKIAPTESTATADQGRTERRECDRGRLASSKRIRTTTNLSFNTSYSLAQSGVARVIYFHRSLGLKCLKRRLLEK